MRSVVQLVTVWVADDQHVDVCWCPARVPRVASRPRPEKEGRLDAWHSGELFCNYLAGPNDRNSSSVRPPVIGEAAAVTSRVLPSLRVDTIPASSALAISRWADDSDALVLSASSVTDHSRPGVSSTSVSNSACSRERSSGRNAALFWPGLCGALCWLEGTLRTG